MKKLSLILLFLLIPTLANAQSQRNPCFYNVAPSNTDGCTAVSTTKPLPVVVDAPGGVITNSATGTTGAVAATLPATTGKTTYICGFTVSSSGATTPTAVTVAITNTISGTMNFVYSVVAVATDNQVPMTVPFSPCIPANATNTTIVVTQPGVGAGATAAATTAWGYQQ